MDKASSITLVNQKKIYELHEKMYGTSRKARECLGKANHGLHSLRMVASELDVDVITLIEYLEVRHKLLTL